MVVVVFEVLDHHPRFEGVASIKVVYESDLISGTGVS